MSRGRTFGRERDAVRTHQEWLSLVEVSGPFLSVPVLRSAWPELDSLNRAELDRLRLAHATWLAGRDSRDRAAVRRAWIGHVLRELLGWDDAVRIGGLDELTVQVPEHDTTLTPHFALTVPGAGSGAAPDPGAIGAMPDSGVIEVAPDSGAAGTAPVSDTTRIEPRPVAAGDVRLLGMISNDHPMVRMRTSTWAATPVDRMAQLCRHHGVELGLVTDGRWWTLVWAPKGGVTTTAVFDAIPWTEAAERDVLRAFISLLKLDRFFSVPQAERLPALLAASLDNQEEITEALGVQVRQAVELLVTAIGRAGVGDEVKAHEVYRGSVSVMMRLVFLLFAEERGLLPADNEVYATAYSASRLCAELEQRAIEGTETELENTNGAWHRLLAVFEAVYRGVDHPRLTMHPHDGSLFDPDAFSWLPLSIDDRAVLHMLKAVQYVEVGTGKNRERRRLSFRSLDVEQIGYVYEGLLSFEGFRAADTVVGLIGKAGKEAEVELTDLENLAAGFGGTTGEGFAAKLAELYRDSGFGTAGAVARKLTPLDAAGELEATRKLLAATGGDAELARRLLPFAGIIRDDLRGLPLVILPGTLYVTESALRKNTGTHYTPRKLAEEVVEGALEPLIYTVGPLQTADRSQWKPKTAEEILRLKVADIAMGSAAFLVAAARYLGDALVKALFLEGDERAVTYLDGLTGDQLRTVDAEADPLVIEARRQIIEHCLYGADINPMAVEMAKLSLWLVSMDPARPFTFVDDRLVAGDSLLGIASLEQLEVMHMDPAKGRKIHEDLFDWTAGAREKVAELAESRRGIADIELGEDALAGLARKRARLGEVEAASAQLRLFADLTVGAALAREIYDVNSPDRDLEGDHGRHGSTEKGRKLSADVASLRAAELADAVSRRAEQAELVAREQRRRWLATDQVDGSFDRHPIHWPLAFPEVFASHIVEILENGETQIRPRPDGPGFDAIIGNPPFLGGQKLTGTMGVAYREYLVEAIGHGARGSADLVAYFVLRAHELLNSGGQTGLIATNTLAQGDTREVGLDQLVKGGVTIRQAVKSKPWPSRSAVLEYCAIWTSQTSLSKESEIIVDGMAVAVITSFLVPETRVIGDPHRLIASQGVAFKGIEVTAIDGFTMTPEQARELINKKPANADILFPFVNGEDLNSRPDCSGRRWIVNFHDWPEGQAKNYIDCYVQLREQVRPILLTNNNPQLREFWWRYKRPAPSMKAAIAGLKRVIVITLVSKVVMPVMVPTGQVFSHMLGVFATDDTAMLALLSSAPHYWWARARASSMKADLRYTPSDVFETLPLPELTREMRDLGNQLDTFRRNLMLARQAGLTATYNLVNDPKCEDEDIVELRRIHRAIDEAVCRAYGWDDLIPQLDHGHHPVARETRYTVGPGVQRELVDRLLELNHARYAEEVAQGLHDKATKKTTRSKPKPKPKAITDQEDLF
ncbi:Eco57I restriction-modification methylase domain-containing protein [Streptosporangium amethystogenes subsp. fukuiense]|uniref:site-specific DNA-methyltransferase (adenine-specific) n=1 Tax=Streptosporangium amethystogenes subsp. fukuiense TaxID=698418 RepID=A0ABW2TFY3_9ACTN